MFDRYVKLYCTYIIEEKFRKIASLVSGTTVFLVHERRNALFE